MSGLREKIVCPDCEHVYCGDVCPQCGQTKEEAARAAAKKGS